MWRGRDFPYATVGGDTGRVGLGPCTFCMGHVGLGPCELLNSKFVPF